MFNFSLNHYSNGCKVMQRLLAQSVPSLEPKPSLSIPHYFIPTHLSCIFLMKTFEPFQIELIAACMGFSLCCTTRYLWPMLLPPFPSDKQLQQQWGGQCECQAVSCAGCYWLLPDSVCEVSLQQKT